MCGIAGFLSKKEKEIDRDLLTKMSARIAHRGPDDRGEYVSDRIGITHRRLSIIDLSKAGHQPMLSADGRYALAFNGEIYNFRELQNEYLKDIEFSSQSDTEVLLNILIKKNVGALPLLRGMFAIAFWDNERQTLLLARDPFGKKPLYYRDTEDFLFFASEVKALLMPEDEQSLDAENFSKYFLYEYFPAPATGFDDCFQVSAGSYIYFENGKVSRNKYWRPDFKPKLNPTLEEAGHNLDSLLKRAVKRRLISDVPVGLFLSGGLDSTAIGWYMKQASPAKKIHSFSVAFDDVTFDESLFAEAAAEQLGFIHHKTIFSIADFHEILKELTEKMDIPVADASLLPTYKISKLAKKYVTVILDGDGGDELFGGYGTFTAAGLADRVGSLPGTVLGPLAATLNLLPTSHNYFSFDFKLKSFVKGLNYESCRRNQIWLGAFTDKEILSLLRPRFLANQEKIFQEIDLLHQDLKELSPFDQITLLTVNHYMQNEILVKLDRATMFNGLEARTPFLDTDLAEYVFKLPTNFRKNKYLLKKIMRGRIPANIINRKKKGFGVPIGRWFAGPLSNWARDVLNHDKIIIDGFFEPAYIENILKEHRAGKIDHRKKIWTLITFQLWHDNYFAKQNANRNPYGISKQILFR